MSTKKAIYNNMDNLTDTAQTSKLGLSRQQKATRANRLIGGLSRSFGRFFGNIMCTYTGARPRTGDYPVYTLEKPHHYHFNRADGWPPKAFYPCIDPMCKNADKFL